MELIQNTMPVIVDEVTVCIRIFEIQGECNDLIPLNTTDKKVVGQNSDEDDDDGIGYDVFDDKQMDNFNGGGVTTDSHKPSQDPSMSNADSDIIRCNNRIINTEPTTSCESVNEVSKTIEVVGSLLGYDMNGREVEVNAVIGANVVIQ
ncbi:hypothetical protein Tco_0167415 [Tanacetum coccineum]